MGYTPTAEDRALGDNDLAAWYNGGPIKPYTIDEARAYYDAQDPNFIAQFGHDASVADQGAVQNALAALASSMGANYPSRADFYGALVQYGVTSPTVSDIAQAAGQGIAQAVNITAGLSAAVLGIAALAALVLYGPGLLKAVKAVRG